MVRRIGSLALGFPAKTTITMQIFNQKKSSIFTNSGQKRRYL